MNNPSLKVLIIDDEPQFRKSMSEMIDMIIIENRGESIACDSKAFPSFKEALEFENLSDFDVAFIDQNMPNGDKLSCEAGFEAAKELLKKNPSLICFMVTAYGSADLCARALTDYAPNSKKCFHHYITKPPTSRKLIKHLASELVLQRYHYRKDMDGKQIKIDAQNFLIGSNKTLARTREMIDKICSLPDWTVLISGKTGSGKELIAKLIHYKTPKRANKPYMAVDCGAIPTELMERELFGAERGAFTGIAKRTIGKLEAANGGTFVLDEIHNLTPPHQIKLLRAINERNFQRLGGTQAIPFDVRIIAITNESLKRRLEEGSFKEDLYHRLNVLPIRVPALSERKSDIPLLVGHFLNKHTVRDSPKKICHELLQELCDFDWDNNGGVRGLESAIQRASGLSDGEFIDREWVFADISDTKRQNRPPKETNSSPEIGEATNSMHCSPDSIEKMYYIETLMAEFPADMGSVNEKFANRYGRRSGRNSIRQSATQWLGSNAARDTFDATNGAKSEWPRISARYSQPNVVKKPKSCQQ